MINTNKKFLTELDGLWQTQLPPDTVLEACAFSILHQDSPSRFPSYSRFAQTPMRTHCRAEWGSGGLNPTKPDPRAVSDSPSAANAPRTHATVMTAYAHT